MIFIYYLLYSIIINSIYKLNLKKINSKYLKIFKRVKLSHSLFNYFLILICTKLEKLKLIKFLFFFIFIFNIKFFILLL